MAAAPAPFAAAEDVEDLTCSVCRDLFVAPICLGCGHTFCARCIRPWHASHAACPECRAPCSTLPSKSIALARLAARMALRLGCAAHEDEGAADEAGSGGFGGGARGGAGAAPTGGSPMTLARAPDLAAILRVIEAILIENHNEPSLISELDWHVPSSLRAGIPLLELVRRLPELIVCTCSDHHVTLAHFPGNDDGPPSLDGDNDEDEYGDSGSGDYNDEEEEEISDFVNTVRIELASAGAGGLSASVLGGIIPPSARPAAFGGLTLLAMLEESAPELFRIERGYPGGERIFLRQIEEHEGGPAEATGEMTLEQFGHAVASFVASSPGRSVSAGALGSYFPRAVRPGAGESPLLELVARCCEGRGVVVDRGFVDSIGMVGRVSMGAGMGTGAGGFSGMGAGMGSGSFGGAAGASSMAFNAFGGMGAGGFIGPYAGPFGVGVDVGAGALPLPGPVPSFLPSAPMPYPYSVLSFGGGAGQYKMPSVSSSSSASALASARSAAYPGPDAAAAPAAPPPSEQWRHFSEHLWNALSAPLPLPHPHGGGGGAGAGGRVARGEVNGGELGQLLPAALRPLGRGVQLLEQCAEASPFVLFAAGHRVELCVCATGQRGVRAVRVR